MNPKSILSALIIGPALMLSVTTTSAATLLNGNFETPISPGGIEISPGSTFITGWTIGGVSNINLRRGQNSDAPFDPPDGLQWVQFNDGGQPPGTFIFQDIQTSIGDSYTLNFRVGSNGNGGGGAMSITAEVSPTSGTVTNTLNATPSILTSPGWDPTVFSLLFQATSESTRILFRDTSTATANADVLLDDVRLTSSVPTPATFWLFGSALAGLGLTRKSRIKGVTQIKGVKSKGSDSIDPTI